MLKKNAFTQKESLLLCFLVFLVIYLYTALFSFSFDDPSLFTGIFPQNLKPQNLAGNLGAQIASMFIYAFGVISFFLPICLFLILFPRNFHLKIFFKRIITNSLVAFSLILLLDHFFKEANLFGELLLTTGNFGTFVSEATLRVFGNVGYFFILSCSLFSALILVWNQNFTLFFKKLMPQKTTSEFTEDNFGHTKENANHFSRSSYQQPENIETPQPRMTLFSKAEKSENTKEIFSEKPSYIHPSYTSFKRSEQTFATSKEEQEETSTTLQTTLEQFGVRGKIVGIQVGPVVSVYEFEPDAGVKLARILSLVDDLALSLKVDSIFINPVPAKKAVGIQIPNRRRDSVQLGDIIHDPAFTHSSENLLFALGKTIDGKAAFADLTTMPHVLSAGATGSGKSVAINTILCSLLLRSAPKDLRLILVDPKMLELSVYENIPHLLMPVICEPKKAALALRWAVEEMERRYKIMQATAVRNINGYNQHIENLSENAKQALSEKLDGATIEHLPYIVLVIDELADLMLTAPKEVEGSIQRLAQKARASGIHLVLATQRPSVDVITGVIKANLPCRMSFQVVSKHDSRTILDQNGAERLLGKGDFLFQRPGFQRLERLQGAFVNDQEVVNFVSELKKNSAPQFDSEVMNWIDSELARESDSSNFDDFAGDDSTLDAKFSEAIQIAEQHGFISASFLQRHLKIGYNRAARIVDYMEKKGLIDKQDSPSKPRKWLGYLPSQSL